VVPGTTAKYQEKYPSLRVLFNPEFLTEVTSEQDFLHPDKQLVGYTPKSQAVAEEVLVLLPAAPYKKAMPSGEAEMVKYMVNCFYAVKVTFANQIYDICTAAGLDYETVKEAFTADKRVVNQHLEIFHKGYRGFGGKCLRKDTYSLIDFAEKLKVDPALFKAAKELNLKLNDNK
jgi:UDPglucose 6-dehydrogenase